MKPLVDICVCLYNQSVITRQFLPHFVKHTKGVDYTLYLLDNGSDDPNDRTKGVLRCFKANTHFWGNLFRPWARGVKTKIMRSETNLHFAGGNNLLAKQGNAPWICFINNDAFPHNPNWLYRLIATAEERGYDMAGPVSDRVMGIQQMRWNGSWPTVHSVPVLSGFCFVIRREAFEAVGGFDERFKNGDEDCDLSFMVAKRAWRERRDPQALGVDRRVYVRHACSASLAPWCAKNGEDVNFHFAKTREMLNNKHGYRCQAELFFYEQGRIPQKEWHNIGVLPNGYFYQFPGSPADGIRSLHRGRSRAYQASGRGAATVRAGTRRGADGSSPDQVGATAPSEAAAARRNVAHGGPAGDRDAAPHDAPRTNGPSEPGRFPAGMDATGHTPTRSRSNGRHSDGVRPDYRGPVGATDFAHAEQPGIAQPVSESHIGTDRHGGFHFYAGTDPGTEHGGVSRGRGECRLGRLGLVETCSCGWEKTRSSQEGLVA